MIIQRLASSDSFVAAVSGGLGRVEQLVVIGSRNAQI